jgi:hypothetical protein
MTVSYTQTTSHLAEFSPRRLYWLIRNRILQDLIPLAIGAAIILGLNLLALFFAPHMAFFNNTQGILWTIVILIGSSTLASGAFKDMQSGKSGTDWLLLPATALEKYLAALLELVIILPLVAIAVCTGLSTLLAGLQNLAGGAIWTPLSWNQASFWGCFAVTTLLFLTGSAFFRKQAFLKTLGIMISFSLVLAIFMTTATWLLVKSGRSMGGSGSMQFMSDQFSGISIGGKIAPKWLTDSLSWIWGVLYFGITPLAALAFGYFRIREKEAKDAVQ